MNCKIYAHKSFERELKRLNKKYPSLKKDFSVLLHDLYNNPNLGVSLGSGVRKIRMKIGSKGKGKSHGDRVITLNVVTSVIETEVHLLYIYDKVERESISKLEIEALVKEIL